MHVSTWGAASMSFSLSKDCVMCVWVSGGRTGFYVCEVGVASVPVSINEGGVAFVSVSQYTVSHS